MTRYRIPRAGWYEVSWFPGDTPLVPDTVPSWVEMLTEPVTGLDTDPAEFLPDLFWREVPGP